MADFGTIILYCLLFVSLFFEIFLLLTYLEVREELAFEKNYLGKAIKQFPAVTIIVPCFNEERTVVATIASIRNLDYPVDKLSIIAVDDGSVDGTKQLLKELEAKFDIKVLFKPNGGKHTALNLALREVKTELVGCLDADSYANPEALRKIVPFFEDKTIMAVTPSIKVHEPKTALQLIQKVEYSWGIFLRRMLSSLGALYVTPGPLSIFRTKVLQELGGYRTGHYTEDLEMALRLQKNRYRIVNSHGAHVYTSTPAGLGALYRQRVRWTYGFLNNVLDYREMFFNRKYGNIGLFILPIATFSIFSLLYVVGRILWNNFSKLSDFATKIRVAGLNWDPSWPSFDWYFLNTDVTTFLTVTVVGMSFVILYLSLKLSDGKAKLSRGVFYYLIFYIFLVPLWLVGALFNTVFRRKISWR